MEPVRGLQALPPPDGPTVVTVGFFDGVHVGHRAVLRRAVAEASALGVRSVAVTFDRHPREILTPGREPRLLTTVERKADLITATGIETVVVLEFTEAFSRWPAEAFVTRVLVEGLRVRHAVVGADFTFGFKALGTPEMLMEIGPAHGFSAERVDLVHIGERRVSSSSIRSALVEGDLAWPEQALGRRFALDGTVVPGAGRGTELGWPTANLRTHPRLLLPGSGIYAGRARVGSEEWVAAISVGTNPTFGVEPLHVESYLLDFEGDLEGSPMSVEFWARLRDEVRFETAEELSRAIEDDVRRTRLLVPAP
ncbi:MAG TPA: bifunctional riboflavin kinase/FAD synthetase [Actinomycetota bacterium]|nr:bifunctional riboflavin kinase/FAD synthetase [Actinomycetota bacterium]